MRNIVDTDKPAFLVHIKFEFGIVSFPARRRTKEPGEKLSGQGENQATPSTHMGSASPGLEPMDHRAGRPASMLMTNCVFLLFLSLNDLHTELEKRNEIRDWKAERNNVADKLQECSSKLRRLQSPAIEQTNEDLLAAAKVCAQRMCYFCFIQGSNRLWNFLCGFKLDN